MDFLELEAYLAGAFLHPGGEAISQLLRAECVPPESTRVLDVGCGTAATAVLMARGCCAHLIGLDRSPSMLQAAHNRVRRARVAQPVTLVQADAARGLPFADGVFDVVYAESVIALLDPEPALRASARVLRGGGRLALVERIWKPGLSQSLVDHVNARSRRAFGIPAATRTPLDAAGWLRLLREAGLDEARSRSVLELVAPGKPSFAARRRLNRLSRYLRRPATYWRALRFKIRTRRHRVLWSHLESHVFLAKKLVSEETVTQ